MIGDFDLVVLDLGLPRCDGFEVLRRIRGRGERLPVIVLTARDELESTVSGFEAGADDYLTKPFHFDELLVRVRARLRPRGEVPATELRRGRGRCSTCAPAPPTGRRPRGRPLRRGSSPWPRRSCRNAGAVLSREQLLSRVWGYDYDGGSNVVEVYVRYLRRKLGADAIETVRGMGYRFRR